MSAVKEYISLCEKFNIDTIDYEENIYFDLNLIVRHLFGMILSYLIIYFIKYFDLSSFQSDSTNIYTLNIESFFNEQIRLIGYMVIIMLSSCFILFFSSLCINFYSFIVKYNIKIKNYIKALMTFNILIYLFVFIEYSLNIDDLYTQLKILIDSSFFSILILLSFFMSTLTLLNFKRLKINYKINKKINDERQKMKEYQIKKIKELEVEIMNDKKLMIEALENDSIYIEVLNKEINKEINIIYNKTPLDLLKTEAENEYYKIDNS